MKDRNTYLPEFIRQKIEKKYNLRRIHIQTKDQSIKPSLNLIEK